MDGTVASTIYPSTKTVTYAYDRAGRVSAVSRGAEAIASSVVYAAHGPVQSLTLGNGLFETVLYNDRLQPYQMNLGTSAGSGNVWSLVNTYGPRATIMGTCSSSSSRSRVSRQRGNCTSMTRRTG